MFQYNIINPPKWKINQQSIDTIFSKINQHIKKTQKGFINIVFTDEDSIKKLNKNYRKKDKTTDVLSFHYFDCFDKIEENEIAWEILLSENHIIEQWKEYGLWNEKELYKLIIHSLLHILWYDHEKDHEYEIMQDLEDTIWKEVFEK